MNERVSYERIGRVAVITVDNPPVNALNVDVRRGLIEALDRALADSGAAAIVLACAGRTFIAGADIREFGKAPAQPGLREVIQRFDASPKPIVAALHGTALGGGLELALGCNYRVAAADARVGFPEIKLGLFPGAGGTQRLPRLAGMEAALRMTLSGEFVAAAEAKRLGIADELIAGELRAGVLAFAERIVDATKHPRVRDRSVSATPELLAQARKDAARTARGQVAQKRCIDALELTLTTPFDAALARERELFEECLRSPQARAMIHVFFGEREAAQVANVPPGTPTRSVSQAAVIGAGTMGGGIAMCFANAGIPVRLVEMTRDALERGLAAITRNYAATVAKGRLSQSEMDRRVALIQGGLEFGVVRDADIVIEAVFEEMDIKKDVFRKLDATARPGAILATNTSTLDVDEIAAATSRPSEVVGMHFFSPANVMRLLEVVRGRMTAKDVIATAMKLGRTIGKVPVLVGVCDGFVGNRMLHRYLRQAQFLVEEGASPQRVDKAIYEFGFPMGPFAMMDLVGLDVGWRIRQRQAKTRDPNERYSRIADLICERGRFGQKTGSGWYRYDKGDRTPIPDPEIERLIEDEARRAGVTRRAVDEEEIVKRCVYALVNEGAKILDEGIAQRASDIDVIYVYGYGFPAWRGGPMFHADLAGLANVLADIRKFAAMDAGSWAAAPLLEQLASSGRRFADLATDKAA
ncbi:MAG TPA: 3-hydroxyacyl-CoA dehydrogenase NAD-binding domain-containing protein [Alphaproteobacteria bacterium]|nr:3-hydroxyacyl-CoA dehydrogenase NAD-binding domain-containing protein [Alphaproteobacteria bacterium]